MQIIACLRGTPVRASSCVVYKFKEEGKCLDGTNGHYVYFNIVKGKFSFRHLRKLH